MYSALTTCNLSENVERYKLIRNHNDSQKPGSPLHRRRLEDSGLAVLVFIFFAVPTILTQPPGASSDTSPSIPMTTI
jgi:hypothetical protein